MDESRVFNPPQALTMPDSAISNSDSALSAPDSDDASSEASSSPVYAKEPERPAIDPIEAQKVIFICILSYKLT